MLVCVRLKIKTRRCFLLQHVAELCDSWVRNIMATKLYIYSREGCQTMEEKRTKFSLHYRNYLYSKVHQVQLVVSKEIVREEGHTWLPCSCPYPLP